MVKLFGREDSRKELSRRVGSLSQIILARPFQLIEGGENGVRGIHIHTGTGFSFIVLFDRDMDIGYAEYQGAPLS